MLLSPRKSGQANNMSVKTIKKNKNNLVFYIHHNFNTFFSNILFSNSLKCTDVWSVSKSLDKTDKENDTTVRFFDNLNKIYGRLIYDELCPYFDLKILVYMKSSTNNTVWYQRVNDPRNL